jgi:hypothetical protein
MGVSSPRAKTNKWEPLTEARGGHKFPLTQIGIFNKRNTRWGQQTLSKSDEADPQIP